MGMGGEVLKAGAANSPSFLSFFLGSKGKVGKDPSHCTSGECLRKALSYVSKLGESSPCSSSPFLFLIIRDKTQKVTPTLLKDPELLMLGTSTMPHLQPSSLHVGTQWGAQPPVTPFIFASCNLHAASESSGPQQRTAWKEEGFRDPAQWMESYTTRKNKLKMEKDGIKDRKP